MKQRWASLARHPMLVTSAVALLVRVAFVVAQLELNLFDIAFDAADSSLYRSLAHAIASGDGFVTTDGEPTAYVGVGYPLFLAGLFQISDSTLFIALVQAVMGAVTVGLMAWLGGVAAGAKGSWVAGSVGALYPHLVFWTGYVLTETLYVFLLIAGVALAMEAIRRDDRRPVIATLSGAAFGAAALVRPIALGLALLLVALGVLVRSRRAAAAWGFVGLVFVMTPWVMRNAVQLGSPVVTSTESGFVLWQGNSPGATGGTRGYVDHADFTPLDLPPGMSEVETDATYRREALEWMRDHPGRVVALVPKKLANMWRPTYEGASPFNTVVTYATYLPLLMLSAVGLFRLRGRPVGILLLVFVGYHLVVHGLVTGMIRFRLPVEAALVVATSGIVMARNKTTHRFQGDAAA